MSFPRIRAPGGWLLSSTVTSAEFETFDQNLSRAIDGTDGGAYAPSSPIEIGGAGLRVSGTFQTSGDFKNDRLLLRNWFDEDTTPLGDTFGHAVHWFPGREEWVTFGVAVGNPTHRYSPDGRHWYNDGVTIPVGSGLTIRRYAFAYNPNDVDGVVLIGGLPGAASTSKIRRSSDGGYAWSAENTINNGTEAVEAIAWHAAANLFIAVLSNGTATNIETSPDGLSWTQRTAPNAHGRKTIASNGTIVVVAPGSGGVTDKVITSTDGTSYTERTLPATTQAMHVVYSPYWGRFYIAGSSPNEAFYSADGISWTQVPNLAGEGHPAVQSGSTLVALDHLIVAYNGSGGGESIRFSADGGLTWRTAIRFNFTGTARAIGSGGHAGNTQLVLAEAVDGAHRATLAFGLWP